MAEPATKPSAANQPSEESHTEPRSGLEIWEPFAVLRRDMEQRFADFWRDFGLGRPLAGTAGAAPRVDVSETEQEVKVEAELPGVDEKDVEIMLADRRLTIKGEKRQEKEEKKKDYHLIERSRGSFARTITLPFDAEPDQVKAQFANGVLTVTLPKPPEVKARTKRIPISAG